MEIYWEKSAYALGEHGVGDLQEARDVRAGDEVALHAVFLGGFGGIVVDVLHDVVQLRVNLFKAPAVSHGVLAHFESGGCNAACIGSLGGSEKNAGGLESVSLRRQPLRRWR